MCMLKPLFFLSFFALLFGCSSDSNIEEPIGMQTCKMVFAGTLQRFDSETRTTTVSFHSGDVMYLKLGNTITTATYNGYDWIVTIPEDFPDGSSGNCVAYFIENGNNTGANVSLTFSSIVYTGTGSYSNTKDALVVNATVSPVTSRIRFRGTSGTQITVSGLQVLSSFDAHTFATQSSSAPIDLTVKSDGFTPYVYSTLSSDRKLSITYNMECYTSTLPSTAMQIGHSGFLDIPTSDSHDGWTKTIVETDGTPNLTLSAGNVVAGKEFTLNVNLNNPVDSICGVQADIYLPEGLEFVLDECEEPTIETGRSTKITTECALQSNGALRILCYSSKNYTYDGTEGAIATIQVKAAKTFTTGDITMKNIVLSSYNNKKVAQIKPADFTLSISCDGYDITNLTLSADDVVAGKEFTLNVELNNPDDAICGVQADIYLPEGLEFVLDEYDEPTIEGGRSTKITTSGAIQKDGALRILCYSSKNYLYEGTEGAVAAIQVKAAKTFTTGDIIMKRIVLSSYNNKKVAQIKPADFTLHISCAGESLNKQIGPLMSKNITMN